MYRIILKGPVIILLGIMTGCVSAPTTQPFTQLQISQSTGVDTWKKVKWDRVQATSDNLLKQLGYDPKQGSAIYSAPAQDASEKKWKLTVISAGASAIAAAASGGSTWIVGGLSVIAGIGTLGASHYGDKEAACVETDQAVTDILIFQNEWAEKIADAKVETDTAGYDDAEASLVKEVKSALLKCPVQTDKSK
jgi:hypothetical protein